MKTDLVVFADYGLDDAAATVSLAAHREKFGKIVIIPIGGNVPVSMAYDNCITLLSHLDLWDVTVVDTREISQPSEYLADIHGKDGMGDVLQRRSAPDGFASVPFSDWIETLTGEEMLLSLGPCTLVKRVLERYPTCSLVFMGGCAKTEPNFGEYEFNQALDAGAFAYCASREHVAITLDTCRVEKLDMRLRDEARFGDSLHDVILKADVRLSITRGEEGCYVWDDVAVCYLLHPERFVIETMVDRQGNALKNARYISQIDYDVD